MQSSHSQGTMTHMTDDSDAVIANSQIGHALIEALANEDQRALSALLHDDVVWRVVEGTALPTRMEGKREIGAGFAPWFEKKASPLVFDDVRVHATGACAIVEVRNHATMKDGTEYRGEGVVVLDVRDDKIAEIREYLNTVSFNRAMGRD